MVVDLAYALLKLVIVSTRLLLILIVIDYVVLLLAAWQLGIMGSDIIMSLWETVVGPSSL